MNKMSYVKRGMMTAVCIALCVVLPMAFHSIQNAGAVFGPMHIPVLLCGLVCGAPFGLLCGVAGVLLSTVLTGMPVAAYLPAMLVELAAYGLISGWGMRIFRTKHRFLDLYLSLLAAMLGGRIVAGVAKTLIFAPGSLSMAAWVTGYFVTALPGIVLQLLLIPAVVFALEQARLIPARYPR